MPDVMVLGTAMYKVFLSCVLPLAALACLWFSVIFLFRGVRGLLRRGRAWLQGLHASSALPRQDPRGNWRYVPLFVYTTFRGEEVDILGKECFTTAEEALRARRPLVYANERPDAAVARSAACFLAVPVGYLFLAVLLAGAAHVLLLFMPV